MEEIIISYDGRTNNGTLTNSSHNSSSVWQRLVSSSLAYDANSAVVINQIRLPWYQMLNILREFIPLQRTFKFKFSSDPSSKALINRFLREQKFTASLKTLPEISNEEVEERLLDLGFTKRTLRSFQKRDIARLIAIPNGANFSVPGAGKTTVTLAVHFLSCDPSTKLFVICPKAAFTAWSGILTECVNPLSDWAFNSGVFVNLSNLDDRSISEIFNSEQKYFVTNYENFVARKELYGNLISYNTVHLVLDESHRMKAGQLSQRGAALLSVANLPIRKDILSGTPMPQGPSDLQSQVDFLWPGSDMGLRIQRGETPRDVIEGLYTRTTKNELELPPVRRSFISVPMSQAQAALYGIVRNDALHQLSSFRNGNSLDIIKARKSVMRLLQIASNPLLAVRGIVNDSDVCDHAVVQAIVDNPESPKIEEVCRKARANAKEGKKTVIWTIFTQNIHDLEYKLSDLNPVSIYGQIKSGDDEDLNTREGRLLRFHVEDECKILIANPAAAGEGISLHTVCHEAIYLDRSYVSTHYLQSIDRIHRLGLLPDTVTNVTIIQAAPPSGIGSIDYSVSRRLASKIRAMQLLLDDEDLHMIALDEENAPEPVDYSIEVEDIADLIAELEGKIPYDSSLEM